MDHPHHGMYHPEKPEEIIVVSNCRAATTPRALWNTERLYALLELSLPQAAPTTPNKGQQMMTEKYVGVLLQVQCAPQMTTSVLSVQKP